MRSMTGFATKSFILPVDNKKSAHITISIKSLNARFFEASFKMPSALSIFEIELLKTMKKSLIRGNIFCNIYLNDTTPLKGEISPNFPLCKQYISAANALSKETGITNNLSIADIINTPQMLKTEETTLPQKTKIALLSFIQEAMVDLVSSQKKEGASLLVDCKKRLEIILSEFLLLETRSQKHVVEYKEKLKNTLIEIEKSGQEAANDTRKGALYATLDKIDVHEEIIRFKTHLERIIELLENSMLEKGKRFDFMLQELSREINTIAAKASDSTIGSIAVNIKVELEKLREQAQNIV